MHYLALLPSVDPYLAAAVSLSRSALGGAGAVMVHYTRVQGLTDLPTEAAEVARAARDVGVRVGFAVAMRDRNPLVYGPSEPILAALSARGARARSSGASSARRCRSTSRSRWSMRSRPRPSRCSTCSTAGRRCSGAATSCCEAIARGLDARPAAASTCICWRRATSAPGSIANYPGGIVRFLDGIGFLSPRLTLAHCTWARPDELELIAERGATISVNTSSNLHLRSGIAPLKEMVKRGCRVALGLDGSTLDEDDDALREMRLAASAASGHRLRDRRLIARAMLHRGPSSTAASRSPTRTTAARSRPASRPTSWCSTGSGRRTSGCGRISIRSICLFARTTMRHIQELIVAGRQSCATARCSASIYPAMREELLARLRATAWRRTPGSPRRCRTRARGRATTFRNTVLLTCRSPRSIAFPPPPR